MVNILIVSAPIIILGLCTLNADRIIRFAKSLQDEDRGDGKT